MAAHTSIFFVGYLKELHSLGSLLPLRPAYVQVDGGQYAKPLLQRPNKTVKPPRMSEWRNEWMKESVNELVTE